MIEDFTNDTPIDLSKFFVNEFETNSNYISLPSSMREEIYNYAREIDEESNDFLRNNMNINY